MELSLKLIKRSSNLNLTDFDKPSNKTKSIEFIVTLKTKASSNFKKVL